MQDVKLRHVAYIHGIDQLAVLNSPPALHHTRFIMEHMSSDMIAMPPCDVDSDSNRSRAGSSAVGAEGVNRGVTCRSLRAVLCKRM